jgi:CelD/BcsL family acetyltransferase involved in cellulose biosynthesis
MIDYFGNRIFSDTWVVALFVDKDPVAISFGFKDKDSWLLYQIAMADGKFSAYSPGTLLLMYVMQHCCESGVREFDLSLGDERYKKDWCEKETILMNDTIVVSAWGHVASRLLRASSLVRRFIASNSSLYKRGKVMKAKLKGLRYSP